MAEQEQAMSPEEQEQIGQIAINWFRSTSKSEEEAQKMLSGLVHMVKEDGAKLVHLGNVLFLILVQGKGVVEVHTIGTEAQPRMLAEDFKQLAAYLKNVGVKTAYTYTPDNRYGRLAQLTGLKIKQFKAKIDGEVNNVYALEL